MADSVSRGLNK